MDSPVPSAENREAKTTVGNYFVANYPPFSFWKPEHVPAVTQALSHAPAPGTPLGLYLHIPFCRKRCDFCYFKVYTDKNSSEVKRYLSAALREMELYAAQPLVRDRSLQYVYFGGGTPSYLSVEQMQTLFSGMREIFDLSAVREVTFECEPGTLQEPKIEALHELGVTRLSLGIENFNPEILELNNRAHRAKEIYRAYEFARQVGFTQINLDLIAGMVGETDENWQRCIDETIRLAPESVTIYQMEVPYNTTIYRNMQDGSQEAAPVADWPTKRRWTDQAFRELEKHGYEIGSAYTAKKTADVEFVYRDALWNGADMLGVGVSSFGHLAGVHVQNEHQFDPYLQRVEAGELPVLRALPLSDDERLIREFILKLKLGRLKTAALNEKFGVDVIERFAKPLEKLRDDGWLSFDSGEIQLVREGLLQVDSLLQEFFLEQHRGARYA